jgi:DNA invertase Pin-like site-specific DNA recombinase
VKRRAAYNPSWDGCWLSRTAQRAEFSGASLLADITSRNAAYKSLAEPWCDTTNELGEVLAALIGYIARKTREDILRRTAAGRHRAMAAGVRFGRKPKLSAVQRVEAIGRRDAGEDRSAIARSYNVSSATISRLRQDASVSGGTA